MTVPLEPADLERAVQVRLDLLREGWIGGYPAAEIARVTGIPLGLVAPAAVGLLRLPERPPADTVRSAAMLKAWNWFRWWRRQWWRPRRGRRRK